MKLTDADKGMGKVYNEHKTSNGGHKTAPKGKYGFKSIQFKLVEAAGDIVHGPFLGRGSALRAYKNEIKLKGKPTAGVKFVVEEVFKHKAKSKGSKVDRELAVFELS